MRNRPFILFISLILFISHGSFCDSPSEQSSRVQSPPEDGFFHTQHSADQTITDNARVLAGLMPEDKESFKKVTSGAAYKSHSRSFQNIWNKGQKLRLAKLPAWSESELSQVCSESRNIFYPFGGADILHSSLLFPCGVNTIMIGLEPPGYPEDVRKMSDARLNRYLGAVRQSLYSIIEYSFFRTIAMRTDFDGVLNGVAPVLAVFLVRLDYEIIAGQSVLLTSDGKIREASEAAAEGKKGIPGVRFYYRKSANDQVRTVTYFSTDISDTGLAKTPYFLPTLEENGPYVTYLKAASYLMHRDSFSKIRNFILTESHYVLQDDSGIPVRFFPEDDWNRTFYGSYTQPIPLFKVRHQTDLRRIYVQGKDIKPLDFGIGYMFRKGTSTMMLASPKKAPAADGSQKPAPVTK